MRRTVSVARHARTHGQTIRTSFVTPATDIDPTCSDGASQLDNDATLTGKDADLPRANRRRSAAWVGCTARSDKARYGCQLTSVVVACCC